MNPPAATSAGRSRTSRRTTSPAPRRVSGPARGRVEAPARGRVATPPRGRVATPPRVRIERPAKRRPASTVAARGLRAVRALPDHQLLDRVVRGRAWIPLLGVLLAGIVAMQVEVLKLGASMGRSIETSSALAGRNASLRASVAALSDDQRIERLAAAQGMVMPAPDQVGFLARHPRGDVGRALGNIHQPNPASFAALISPNGAVVTGADQGNTGPQAPVQSASMQAPVQTQVPVQTQAPMQSAPAQASVQTQAPVQNAGTQASLQSAATTPASAPLTQGSTTTTSNGG